MQKIADQIEKAVGKRPFNIKPLGGGCVAEVVKAEFEDGQKLVGKIEQNADSGLAIEGNMLRYLKAHTALLGPEVVFSSDTLLLMTYIEGNDPIDYPAAQHAAELLAELHSIHASQFGFDFDTLIGGLHQPNPNYNSWNQFFAEQRLVYMAKEAFAHKRINAKLLARVERFASDIDQFIQEPKAPALLHGDIWGGNVIVQDSRIAGFIDPAIYFGHPEIELAFITLFHTFGSEFFNAYDSLIGIEPGFFSDRRDIYNLYPLLVHTRLFGGHYPSQVEQTLKRFGY